MDHAAHIKDRPDHSKEIAFADRPLMIDGTEVRALIMREPTVADQLAADRADSPAAGEIAMIGNLVELAPETIRGLPLAQYARLQAALAGFLS